MMKQVAWIAVAASLLFPQAAAATHTQQQAVRLSTANHYAKAVVAPAVAASINVLTTSKAGKCKTVDLQALCYIKSNDRLDAVYCVTLVAIYRTQTTELAWRDLYSFCSSDAIL